MRKKIEGKEVKQNGSKEVKQSNGVKEKNMETLEMVYGKMVRRLSYLKDRDTSDVLLDYQDALQNAMLYCQGKVVDNPKHYLRKAVAMNMKLNRQQEYRYDLTDKNFESEVFAYPLGEILEAKKAIQKLLTVEESSVLEAYGNGYTLDEICAQYGFEHRTQANRVLAKAAKKIDSLRLAFLYDSKVAAYQGKQGKADVKWNSDTIHKEDMPPSVAVYRRFLCLDQSKVKKQYHFDSRVKRFAFRKEAVVEIASATDRKKYEVKLLNMQYSGSSMPAYDMPRGDAPYSHLQRSKAAEYKRSKAEAKRFKKEMEAEAKQ